jgi:hypothetical protein
VLVSSSASSAEQSAGQKGLAICASLLDWVRVDMETRARACTTTFGLGRGSEWWEEDKAETR